MGPNFRYLVFEVLAEDLIWQDPILAGTMPSDAEVKAVKDKIAASGLTVSQLIKTAWASASTFRKSDFRGGANGARVRLAPQRDWEVNEPAMLARCSILTACAARCRWPTLSCSAALWVWKRRSSTRASTSRVPFTGGRGDATAEQTDADSFAVMEPEADAFRNYLGKKKLAVKTEEMMLDRASLLGLSVPRMTVLIGGLQVLGANHARAGPRSLHQEVGAADERLFVNLLDMTNVWKAVDGSDDRSHVATDRKSGRRNLARNPRRPHLRFHLNPCRRRSLCRDGPRGKAQKDFVKAWTKIMNVPLRPRVIKGTGPEHVYGTGRQPLMAMAATRLPGTWAREAGHIFRGARLETANDRSIARRCVSRQKSTSS